jgi:glycosyltransferase involved in cell wall biosynthesis
MKILHVEMTGGLGGIQTLTRDIIKYSHDHNEIYYIKQGGLVAEQIEKNKGVVTVDEKTPFFRFFLKAHTLFNFINHKSFDVVIFHDAGIISFLCLRLIKRGKIHIPCYVYEHDDVFSIYNKRTFKTRLYKEIFIHTLKMSDGILCISKFVISQGQKLFPNKKSFLVYNGIDLKNFKPSKLLKKENKMIEILFVGRIIKDKGLETLVKCLAEMKNEISFHLKIVGGGDDEETIKQLIDLYRLNDEIEIKDPTPNVVQYYQKADFFVHPAIWNEGFGITLVEALACGVPCIGPRSGAIPEIIEDGKNGFLYDSKSETGLKEALRKAFEIKTKNNYLQMRKDSIFSASTFDINNTIKRLEEIFKNTSK